MILGIAFLIFLCVVIWVLTKNTNAAKKQLQKEQQALNDERNNFSVFFEEKKRTICDRESYLYNATRELKEHQEQLAKREVALAKKEREIHDQRQSLDNEIFQCSVEYEKQKRFFAEREAALQKEFKSFLFSHALKILSHDYFKETRISKHLSSFSYFELLKDAHFISATTEKRIMKYPINVTAEIKGETDTYTVTLNSCTCPDFVYRNVPCKHMYQLALEMGVLFYFKDRFESELTVKEKELREIDAKNILENERLCMQENLLTKKKKLLLEDVSNEALKSFFSEKSQTYPWFAKIFSDYIYVLDMRNESSLKSLKGSKASMERERLRSENRDLNFQNKLLEHQLAVYESVAPWLLEFKEFSPDEVVSEMSISDDGISVSSPSSDYELIKTYISEYEYNRLSDSEKYQLALDRWKKRSKSNWAAGIEYERYIGYLYETQNYHVKYQGALSGFEDMGIDVIATKGNTTYLIQCKRYSDKKTVHENTVFQLYGSYVYYKTQRPSKNFIPVIYTSTILSDIAQKCSDFLKIEVHSNYPLQAYPLIKCNISASGEKIYHLPFDQQYDRIVISPKKGEFYANTVQEAEDNGFRRAFRWHSN